MPRDGLPQSPGLAGSRLVRAQMLHGTARLPVRVKATPGLL